MLAPIAHILPVAIIRRERAMPASGRIIARRGQEVHPADVVAEVMLRPEHLLLDIGRGLGLEAKEADHYIQRRAGDEVGQGDVIAGPVGIGKRVVRTPQSGTVVVAGEGQVLLEVEGKFSELKAGYSGVITDIIEDRGVVVEALGTLIQGVWGNGKLNFGVLNVMVQSPDGTIIPGMMDISLRGSVIVFGYCEDEKVLRKAEELSVHGMILGSMDAALVPIASNMNYPILLVEGFGKLPINPDAFRLLTSSAMREVVVNAELWNRMGNSRPEAVITIPEGVSPEVPTEQATFAIGQTVRVVSNPYKSMVGTLTSLPQGFALLPSGLRAQVAEVRLAGEQTIQIPLANLEVIG